MKFFWSYKQKIKFRRSFYQQLAKKLGLQFQEKDTDRFGIFLKDIKIFKRGRPKKNINNIICQETEDPNEHHYFFDYHYVVSTGKSTRIFDQTILFIQTKKLALPDFHLRPKAVYHRVADFFGKKRVDLGNDYLNKNYLLFTTSPHVEHWIKRKSILDLIQKYPKLEIYGANYQLVLFRPNKLAPVEKLEEVYLDYFQLYQIIEALDNESN